MLQHLCGAPLLSGMPNSSSWFDIPFTADSKVCFRVFEQGIHAGHLAFPRASGKMLRDNENHPSYNRKVSMKSAGIAFAQSAALGEENGAQACSPRLGGERILAAAVFVILALMLGCDSNPAKQPEAKPEAQRARATHGEGCLSKGVHCRPHYACGRKTISHRVDSDHRRQWPRWKVGNLASQLASAIATRREALHLVRQVTRPMPPLAAFPTRNEDVYNPGNASTQVFDVAFLESRFRSGVRRRSETWPGKRFWKKVHPSL